MSQLGLFRRKEAAAVLVLSSLLLAVHYFSHNLNKARQAFDFYYLSRGVDASPESNASRQAISIEARSGDRTLARQLFYTPLCSSSGYSVYLLEADVRESATSGDLRMVIQGAPAEVGQVEVLENFSACVDQSRQNVYLFVHGDYLPTLQQVYENRDAMIAQLRAGAAPK